MIMSFLFTGLAGFAEEPVPEPVSARFPNIKASLDDGFYVLAEQQARGVLRGEPSEEDAREVALLLVQALWGQKRYSEMLELLAHYNGEPAYTFWRARANYELTRYASALNILSVSQKKMEGSRYEPAAMRLKGHIEYITGKLDDAETTLLEFSATFPEHPERLSNQFELAGVYTQQKKIPEAISIYKVLAEEKNPHVAQRARLKLGHVLYTQGATENYDEARALFVGLAANAGTHLVYRIDAYVDLAALEEKVGNRTAAKAALRKGITLSPDARQRVPLKLSLARMLLRDDDTEGALKLLEECRAEAPNEVIAAQLQLEKAGALLQANRYENSVEAYQVYLDVSADDEGLALAYLGKGLGLWELKRFAESAAALDKAVKGLKVPEQKADALFKAGDSYYQAGGFEDAEKRYRSFVTDFPEHLNIPNALYQLGLSLAKTGRTADALATFQTLESNHSASPFAEQAALRSADILLSREEWLAALDKYTQIGQTYTNRSAASLSLHQRGLVFYRLGQYADAQQAFEVVLSDHPQSEYVPQATYMRSFCLYLQGEVEEAVQACQKFIKDYPDSSWTPEVIFWLAEQYYNQGLYQDADPLFMRVAQDFKSNKISPRALYWAGRCSATQANYVQAIERYSEVAKNYPESEVLPQTRFAQGDALSELGEFARAILAFEEIIKNYPESYLVNTAWGRKGDCQFSLAVDNPSRYTEAMNSYQAILDRTSAPQALKLQAEYKVGRCLEKTNMPEPAFNRYMNVVYTFINEKVEHSSYNVMWFTRSAFGAAALKEREKAWVEAVQIYGRVIEGNVPAAEEAAKRIEKIKQENWLLFQQTEEVTHVGIDG
jgi:TolA-binding protein